MTNLRFVKTFKKNIVRLQYCYYIILYITIKSYYINYRRLNNISGKNLHTKAEEKVKYD